MGSLSKNGVLEVNAIDLIAVEALRHFEPFVYRALFENKSILTETVSSSSARHSEEEKKKKIEAIFKDLKNSSKTQVQSIVKVLFPNIQWAWSNYYVSVDDQDFIKLRICHPDRFNRYFSFFMTSGEFSQFEFESVLSTTDNSDKLTKILKNFHEEGRLEAFLEKFESYKQEIPAGHATEFLSSMFEIGEYVSDEHKGFFRFSSLLSLERIILWYLKKPEFKDTRRAVFKDAIAKTSGISLPIIKLADEYDRRSIDKYPDSYSLNEEDSDWIKENILKIIYENKDTDLFKNSIHIARIVLIWKQFEGDKALQWIDSSFKSGEEKLSLIERLMGKSYSSSGYETKTNHYISAFYLKEFFEKPIDQIYHLKTITDEKLRSRYQNVFNSLSRAEDEIKNPEKYKNRMVDFDDD